MGKKVNFLVISALAIIALLFSKEYKVEGDLELLDSGDTSWMLVASAFVLLMTPGLAFFYGGMVHRKNIISTMIKSMVSAGIVSVILISFGFSLSFGESINGIIGNPITHLFLKGVVDGAPALQGGSAMTIPLLLFVLY